MAKTKYRESLDNTKSFQMKGLGDVLDEINDEDIQGTYGEKRIHWQAFAGNSQNVLKLLKAGESVNVRDASQQRTPLHWAVKRAMKDENKAKQQDFITTVRVLLLYGADITLRDEEENIPEDYLDAESCPGIANLFIRHKILLEEEQKLTHLVLKQDPKIPRPSYSIAIDADDSSGDEPERYSVSEQWQRFKMDGSLRELMEQSKIEDPVMILDSFLLHALGIGVLYSRRTTHSYRGQKKFFFGKSDNAIPAEAERKEVLKSVVEGLIADIFSVKTLCDDELEEELKSKYIEQAGGIGKRVVSVLMKDENYRLLFKQGKQGAAYPSIKRELDDLSTHIKAYLSGESYKADVRELEAQNDVSYAQECFGDLGDRPSKLLLAYIPIDYHSRANDYLERKNLLQDKDDSKFDAKKIKTFLAKHRPVKLFERAVLNVLKDESSSNLRNKLEKIDIQNAIAKKMHEYALEADGGTVLDDEQNFKEGADISVSVFKELYELAGKEIRDNYLSYVDRVRIEILEQLDWVEYYFDKRLEEAFKKQEPKFTRAVLGQSHEFKSNNQEGFLANLRLSNRDRTRRIRKYSERHQEIPFGGKKFHRQWGLGDRANYVALEDQEITMKMGRSDIVINLDTYENIYKRIVEIKKYINDELEEKGKDPITSGDIAAWLIEVFDHSLKNDFFYHKEGKKTNSKVQISLNKKEQLLEVLVDLTYLLFGTEAVRNPSSLPLHYMMLNMIANGKMEFKDAFFKDEYVHRNGGGDMPMSMGKFVKEANKNKIVETSDEESEKAKAPRKTPSNVVQCARKLSQCFGGYMPHFYSYPGEDSSITYLGELIRRESTMFRGWLNALDKKPLNPYRALVEAVSEWYSDILCAKTKQEVRIIGK